MVILKHDLQPQNIKHQSPSVQPKTASNHRKTMKKISPGDLICMNDFEKDGLLRVDLAYAKADNLLFGETIYRPQAKFWLHRDLAAIIARAAEICRNDHHLRLILHDGLRPVEAQARMLETRRVRQNPQWLEEPRLLSPPGAGGHPRGMAVDLSLETLEGVLLDMGTPFDFLAPDAHFEQNPAHRRYPGLKPQVIQNRDILDQAVLKAAGEQDREILPLPQEWWDFRFHADHYHQFAPISDLDLPEHMRMCL